MKSTDTARAPNLNIVVSAVGPQIFAFLPLGSILNGFSSPLLVCKSFRDNVYLALSHFQVLDFSKCSHLRQITDFKLYVLINNVVRAISENEVTALNHTGLKVKHIDLSRCRKINGSRFRCCLRLIPNIRQISLASCTALNPEEAGFCPEVQMQTKHLQYLDLSGCSKINTRQFMLFVQGVTCSKLTHLDLSGCSTQICNETAKIISTSTSNLESVNLSGAKKLTEFGFGLIAWRARHTLKNYSVRGCTGIKLSNLLYGEALKIAHMIAELGIDNERSLNPPPNMIAGANPNVGTMGFESVLARALDGMFTAHTELHDGSIRRVSNGILNDIKRYGGGESSRETELGLFGRLEELDIGLIGNRKSKLNQGCIATIAWLNGGRFKKINFQGVEGASIYDINVLLRICGPRLQVFEPDLSSSIPSLPHDVPDLIWRACLRELDLSHCSGLIRYGDVSFLSSLYKLRSLRLDFLEIWGDGLYDFLLRTTRLLRLSVNNCTTVKCSKLSAAIAGNRHMQLLELDAAEIEMDRPLTELRRACPSVLRFNNRRTKLGNERLKEHIEAERWRVGARDTTVVPAAGTKRSREEAVGNNNTQISSTRIHDSRPSSKHVCSLFLTGFSPTPNNEQEFYICKTCNINFGRVVCLTCVKRCHVGHETEYAGFILGYCDCCILSECQCVDQTSTAVHGLICSQRSRERGFSV